MRAKDYPIVHIDPDPEPLPNTGVFSQGSIMQKRTNNKGLKK